IGAAPSGKPGWPLSASWTMSTERKRSMSMQRWSMDRGSGDGMAVLRSRGAPCSDAASVAALVSRQAPRAGWSQRSGRRLTATRKDASAAPSARQGVSSGGALPQRRVDDSLRLGKDRLQVAAAFEAFAVDLVDVLGTGRSCGEPAVVGDHLDTADRRVV